MFYNRTEFENHLKTLFSPEQDSVESLIKLDNLLKKALLEAFAEKDPTADICYDSKGKIDKTALLAEVKSHCETYLAKVYLASSPGLCTEELKRYRVF